MLSRSGPDFDAPTTLKLSIQRALLAEVTCNLVSVTCGIRSSVLKIRAYIRGPVAGEDVERLSFIAGEVIADFPNGFTIEEECVSIDNGPEEMLDFWAFRRASEEPIGENDESHEGGSGSQ